MTEILGKFYSDKRFAESLEVLDQPNDYKAS